MGSDGPWPRGTDSVASCSVAPLLADLGCLTSICLLVWNLLKCRENNCLDDAYNFLKTTNKDIHLLQCPLLLDPSITSSVLCTRERVRYIYI